MKKRIISIVTALLIIVILTSPIPLSQTSFPASRDLAQQTGQFMTSGDAAGSSLGNVHEEGEPTITHLVLVTGDIVTVSQYPSGRRSFAVEGVDANEGFVIFSIRNETYVVPSDANLKKLDLSLFNIDYLLREEYFKLDFTPLLISSDANLAISSTAKDKANKLANDPDIKPFVTKAFKSIPAFAAKTKFKDVRDFYKSLMKKSDVAKVWLDAKVHVSLNETLPIIGLPNPGNPVWGAGYEGYGMKIAIIDTGIDPTHPDVGGPRIVAAQDFTDDGTPDDLNGHGTHVAAIAAGDATASTSATDPFGKFKGVAYQARLINAKVLNRDGWGMDSWVIDGIEWAVSQGANVINLSLVSGWTNGYDPLSLAVNWATDQGVVACVAAGNDGRAKPPIGFWTIDAPGAAQKAITVGATDKTDWLADFSSRGPVNGVEIRLKPDVVAPGVNVYSAHAASAPIYDAMPNPPGQPPNGPPNYPWFYTWGWSGTSMATPHVAGLAALVLQSHGGWQPWQVKDAIMNTAVHLDGCSNPYPSNYCTVYQEGTGRIFAPAAVFTTAILDEPTYSFGIMTDEAATPSHIYTVYNYGGAPINVTLSVDNLIDTGTGTDWKPGHATTTPNVLNNIAAGGSATFTLNLNMTGLPLSLYSGVIVASVEGGAPWAPTLRSAFGFARMNTLTVTKYDMAGDLAQGHWVWKWKVNPSNDLDYWLNLVNYAVTDNNGQVVLYHTNGNYNFVTLSYLNGWPKYTTGEGNPINTIAENVAVNGNGAAVTLDETTTNKVDLDLNKSGQTIAGIRTVVYYQEPNPNYYHWYFYLLWSYPASTESWVSTLSNSWWVTFGYSYYPTADYDLTDPNTVNTSEWHDLLYASKGIPGPIHYTVDYSTLVQKLSQYPVNLGPVVGARRVSNTYTRLFDDPETGSPPWWYQDWAFEWKMSLPQARMEYLSPNVWYAEYLEKIWDIPWQWTSGWFWHPGPWRSWGPGETWTQRWNTAFSNKLRGWVNATTNGLEIYGHAIMDGYRQNYDDYGRSPAGTLEVYGPDNLWSAWGNVSDSFDWWFGPQDFPMQRGLYSARINVTSTQQLSTRMTATYNFNTSVVGTILPDGTVEVPLIGFSPQGLNLQNIAAAGKATVGVRAYSWTDPETEMSLVQMWYSTDDGLTWDSLLLTEQSTNYYEGELPRLSGVYVSLKAFAANAVGNSVTQTTIRAFYIRAEQPGLSALEGFTSLGTGSLLLVTGDLALNPHGTKPAGVGFQQGRDSTPLGYLSGMLDEDQLVVFDTNTACIGSNGRPLATISRRVIISVGGPDINSVAHYYEQSNVTADRAPVTWSEEGSDVIWRVRNGTVVVNVTQSSTSVPPGSSDVFAIQVLRDADNRTVALMYGERYTGTWAAAWYFKFVIYPSITDWQDSYYIVRWTDAASGASANFTPDSGDTFDILSQGSPP
jgi:subtilisin family serine protease